MRVNARFDDEAEQQVIYLSEITGMGVSEVLRSSVQHYYDAVRARRSGLKHLSAFIGQGDSGRSDVASTYKERLAQSWGHKHQPAPAMPQLRAAEPHVPYGAGRPDDAQSP